MSCSRGLILSQGSEVECGWRMPADHHWPSDQMGSLTGRSCCCLPRGCASAAHPVRSPPSPSESYPHKGAEIAHGQHYGFYVLLDEDDLHLMVVHWTDHWSMERPAGAAGQSWAWSWCCGTLAPWHCCNFGSSPTDSWRLSCSLWVTLGWNLVLADQRARRNGARGGGEGAPGHPWSFHGGGSSSVDDAPCCWQRKSCRSLVMTPLACHPYSGHPVGHLA